MLYKSETGISYTIYIYYLSVERKRNVIQLGDRIKAYKYEIHIKLSKWETGISYKLHKINLPRVPSLIDDDQLPLAAVRSIINMG